MKTKPLYALCCALLVISALQLISPSDASAKQQGVKASATDAQSAGAADAIQEAYHSMAGLSAKFVQTTQVALVGKTVTKNGTFRFKKGGKLSIEYSGAEGKRYVSDGTTLWIYVPGDEASLQTFAVNDETVPKEALSFLNGFGQLKTEFQVGTSDAFSGAASGTTALHLVPRAKAKHYESLDALFGPDHLLAELIIKNTSGNVSHYKFSEIRTDPDIPDSLFTPFANKTAPEKGPHHSR